MLPSTCFELTPQISDAQVQTSTFNPGEGSLQNPVASFPLDTHTPLSEQFDDITYPGSEVGHRL